MAAFHLKIITPEKVIYDGEVEEVAISAPQGEIGILPHHINLITKIIPGELRITKADKTEILATGSGLAQMTDNNLSIMVDLVESLENINEKIVEEARQRAKEALEQKTSDEEVSIAEAVLEKALAQLRVKRRHHTKTI